MSWNGVSEDWFQALYGIEVEVEGYYWYAGVDLPEWRVTEDGSLRNGGAEFVLRDPMEWLDAEQAVQELYEAWNWVASVRCGIHVHMNVIGMSLNALKAMLTVYAAAEPAIFHTLCRGREENIFCVPWYLAPGDVARAQRARTVREMQLAAMDYPKYSAMNLAPLRTLGTVEFRGLGTAVYPGPLLRLLDLCRELHNVARLSPTPEEIVRAFERDPLGALRHYVPTAVSERGAELIDEFDSVSVAAGFVHTKPEQVDWTIPEMCEEVY